MSISKFVDKINIYKKYKKLPFRKQKKIIAYIFLLPWLIGLAVFFLPPLFDTLYSSFFTFSLNRDTGMTFCGFSNFQKLFNPNEPMLDVFLTSFGTILYNIPVCLIFSLFIALILNSNFRGRSVVRTIFFLPLILGLNVISIVMANNPVNGLMDNEVSTSGAVLGILSADSVVNFIAEAGIPEAILKPIITSINSIFEIITFTGVQILLFLAALQSIDSTLYEVAEIEGCNKYESFWKITLPMVLPSMKVVVVYTVIDCLARSKIVAYLSSDSMSRYAPGVSAATSFMLIIVTLLIILISVAIIPKGGGEK